MSTSNTINNFDPKYVIVANNCTFHLRNNIPQNNNVDTIVQNVTQPKIQDLKNQMASTQETPILSESKKLFRRPNTSWSQEETDCMNEAVKKYIGRINWQDVRNKVGNGKTTKQCKSHYNALKKREMRAKQVTSSKYEEPLVAPKTQGEKGKSKFIRTDEDQPISNGDMPYYKKRRTNQTQETTSNVAPVSNSNIDLSKHDVNFILNSRNETKFQPFDFGKKV